MLQFVVKVVLNPYETTTAYYTDVIVQMYAQWWGKEYNKRNPPKTVTFLDAYLLEMVSRPKKPTFAAEPFLPGFLSPALIY